MSAKCQSGSRPIRSPRRRGQGAELPIGGLEVQKQLNFRALLDRQIRRLFALENPAGIYSDEMSICNARPVAHQAD